MLKVGLAIVGSFAAIFVLEGFAELVAAGVFGAFAAIAVVLWIVGDVRALTYAWGSVGEQRTAEVLSTLDGSWTVEHDLIHPRGNWDHVVVGPGGVFMIETKQLAQTPRVAGDALVAGRLRFSGSQFRGAAVELRERLRAPWVQAVVTVWGDVPLETVTFDRVVYLSGQSLADWLRTQPVRLSVERQASIVSALAALRAGELER